MLYSAIYPWHLMTFLKEISIHFFFKIRNSSLHDHGVSFYFNNTLSIVSNASEQNLLSTVKSFKKLYIWFFFCICFILHVKYHYRNNLCTERKTQQLQNIFNWLVALQWQARLYWPPRPACVAAPSPGSGARPCRQTCTGPLSGPCLTAGISPSGSSSGYLSRTPDLKIYDTWTLISWLFSGYLFHNPDLTIRYMYMWV